MSQFTECGDVPADYDDDVLASAEIDVLKIIKKVRLKYWRNGRRGFKTVR